MLQGDCQIPAFDLDLAIQAEQNWICRISLNGTTQMTYHQQEANAVFTSEAVSTSEAVYFSFLFWPVFGENGCSAMDGG